MPCPFTSPKMFWAGQNFLRQTKNLFTYCGSHKRFVPNKKIICIQDNCSLSSQKSFWKGTKCKQIFGLSQKIWTGTKHFGTCKRTRHKTPFDCVYLKYLMIVKLSIPAVEKLTWPWVKWSTNLLLPSIIHTMTK